MKSLLFILMNLSPSFTLCNSICVLYQLLREISGSLAAKCFNIHKLVPMRGESEPKQQNCVSQIICGLKLAVKLKGSSDFSHIIVRNIDKGDEMLSQDSSIVF